MKKSDDLKNISDTNFDKTDMSPEAKLRLKNEVKKPMKISVRKISIIGIPAIAVILAFLVVFTDIFPGSSSKVHASDLMNGIKPQKMEPVKLSDDFIKSTADFSIELFKKSYTKDKNSLISPTSVYMALGMTANGADGNTLKEFENLLGKSNLNINDLNKYYSSLAGNLTNTAADKVSIANSIWYKRDDTLNIKKDFLQVNADYYNAAAYMADFNSNKTAADINNWVKSNTHNLIDKIIDQINPNTIMYLINTIYFEDKWQEPYVKTAVENAPFKLQDGTEKNVDFMHSSEQFYLNDGKAQGFIKPYIGGKYRFVALLPNEGVSIDSYINSLAGEGFINLLKNKSNETVFAALPKFKADYKINLVGALQQMGLKDCFGGNANFTKMAASKPGDIYVGEVLHKTYITVDTEGTKAAAVTEVAMLTGGVPEGHTITLDRPFVYAIVDNETYLPIFIGTMTNP